MGGLLLGGTSVLRFSGTFLHGALLLWRGSSACSGSSFLFLHIAGDAVFVADRGTVSRLKHLLLSKRNSRVIVSKLLAVALAGRTPSLFADEASADSEQSKTLMLVMDGINQRYGRGAVRLASENSVGWKPNQERLSPCCTTRWGDIMVAKG